jgi:L-alanine-DL-glutamate epimerase-like enolase superfamily enzyme
MIQLNRRQFLQQSSAVASLLPFASMPATISSFNSPKKITISEVSTNFEREPLATPYGFKGGYITDVWQSVARLQSSSGKHGIGLGTQSVLWCDAEVFLQHSENGGNALMYAMTEKAVQMAKGQTFTTPIELQESILDEVHAYGKKVTGKDDLRETFALNALVAVDNAAWLLYAYENGISDFDTLIPEEYRPALSHRHDKVVSVPSFSFATPVSQMKELVDDGYFFLKIKLGHPGTQREMLDKDKAKITEIHETIGHGETPYTADGKIPYYFDMNGRYEEKDYLLEVLDHAKKIGAFDQIVVVEEPFPEESEATVGDVGVRVAADESAHTEEDVITRIQMGYNAIALKPIAKTLSMTLKMAKVAHEQGIPCLCADLTVNPILVDWNKNVAARLGDWEEFPGMGMMENNGHQNYRDWQEMMSYHPYSDADWVKAEDGVFKLGEDYYEKSGGIFQMSDHYQALFNSKKGES